MEIEDLRKEPTYGQCNNRAVVFEDRDCIAYACYYPQMGGYGGKCIAIFDKNWTQYDNGCAYGGCIDVLVWHDGDFPFSDEDSLPRELHHCDPTQFIEFGEFLQDINEGNKNSVKKFIPNSQKKGEAE